MASNIGCSNPSEVNLHDSLFRGRIPMSVKKQIASLVYEEGKKFQIIVPRVQRQNNNDDCGVFAIAFLVSLLSGLNPTNLTFDSGYWSLVSGASFDPFPLAKVQEKRKQEPAFVQEVPVICECRMPWENCNQKSPSLWCADCGSCKEWYHRKCVPTIPHMICKGSNATWLCPKFQKALEREEHRRPFIS